MGEIKKAVKEVFIDKDKYFTPSIEDIRVGYECEINRGLLPGMSQGWHKFKFTDIKEFHLIEEHGENIIRIPYLTKEAIEAGGWKLSGFTVMNMDGSVDDTSFSFTKDNVMGAYNKETKTLAILTRDPSLDETKFGARYLSPVFRGQCKDINTFRYICKLLNIS